MKKVLGILIAFALLMSVPLMVSAATTADIAVTATPQSISIEISPVEYDFQEVSESETPSTAESYFTVDNTSNIVTDQAISVTTDTWAGGVTWAHDDGGTPGVDTAGLTANQDGTWGVSDVIIKFNATHNLIVDDQAADTDYDLGIKLYAPTSFGDAVEKSITVRITASAAS